MTSFAGASNINADYYSSDEDDLENSSKWGSSIAPVNSLAVMGLKKKKVSNDNNENQIKAKIKKS